MSMQLRTVKKPKNKALEFVSNTPTDNKNSFCKEAADKEGGMSSGENSNSNLTVENETKSRHKLRNTSNNYQGKYKKMNSGKYLYKLNNSEKKPVIYKKKQLRFLPSELVGMFKKFLNKLNKKEEENLLNKKKKREESKEFVKKGAEGHKKISTKLHNLNQFQPMNNVNNFDYQPYMMKSPYDMYYSPNFMENLKSRAFPMEDQQLFYRMNKDFVRLLQMPDYYYRGGYQGNAFPFEQEMPKQKNESIFNLINDKENLNRINKIANEGVNHIVAAFYIKSVQQSRNAKPNESGNNNIVRRASVPINSVNIVDDGNEYNNISSNENFIVNSNIPEREAEIQNGNNITQQLPLDESPKQKTSMASENNNPTANSNKFNLHGINMSHANIFNDKFSPDINEFTANQLNTVHNVLKNLRENKHPEIN